MSMGPEIDSAVLAQIYRKGSSDRIAIVPIEGAIDEYTSHFVRAATKSILEDPSIQAVVLRVDSPGGGVAASDQIWNEIERLKQAGLPVIASYGGYAASGGYYVSCGADQIVAEPTCITGSIGVIAQVMTLDGLMDKVGIEPVTLVASGSPEKNVANDMFRQWDERDRQRVIAMLDAAYERFSSRVSAGRQSAITDPDKLALLANGSIFTAQQALDNGLIDSIGYLDDAIALAESSAKLASGAGEVVVLRLPAPLFGNGLFGSVRAARSGNADWLDAEHIRSFANELSAPRIMYMMH
jgi:protease-4